MCIQHYLRNLEIKLRPKGTPRPLLDSILRRRNGIDRICGLCPIVIIKMIKLLWNAGAGMVDHLDVVLFEFGWIIDRVIVVW